MSIQGLAKRWIPTPPNLLQPGVGIIPINWDALDGDTDSVMGIVSCDSIDRYLFIRNDTQAGAAGKGFPFAGRIETFWGA